MDPTNNIVLYSFKESKLISKIEISLSQYLSWNSFNDLKECFKFQCNKFKYFDDEGELITIYNNEDFILSKELVLDKHFIDDKVIFIASDSILDKEQFGSLEKILNLKIEDDILKGPVHVNSVSTASNSNHSQCVIDDESTSSTSSSPVVVRRKPPHDRNKKYKPIARYAAKMKKELNYLPGSELSDGQTIIKRWRIKNIGSKKWKENSIKCVLLPSDCSSWITYSPVKCPICFADQKIDIEMEISIKGQWNSTESCVDDCSRDINLTWLLFKENLVKNSSDNFKDYILLQLELRINVKRKSLDTAYQMSVIDDVLTKHLSESSIERIDTDFSIVNPSENEENSDKCQENSFIDAMDVEKIHLQLEPDNEDIELPDCPNGGDFQISDFNSPNNYISFEPDDVSNMNIASDGHTMLSLLNQPNYVGRIRSTYVAAEVLDFNFDEYISGVKVRGERSDNAGEIAILGDNEKEVVTVKTIEVPVLVDEDESCGRAHSNGNSNMPGPAADGVIETNEISVSAHNQEVSVQIHKGEFVEKKEADTAPLRDEIFKNEGISGHDNADFTDPSSSQIRSNHSTGNTELDANNRQQNTSPATHNQVHPVGTTENVARAQCQTTDLQEANTISDHMKKLMSMGFKDEERNLRLLSKFGNNLNDVINDILD